MFLIYHGRFHCHRLHRTIDHRLLKRWIPTTWTIRLRLNLSLSDQLILTPGSQSLKNQMIQTTAIRTMCPTCRILPNSTKSCCCPIRRRSHLNRQSRQKRRQSSRRPRTHRRESNPHLAGRAGRR